MIQLINGNEGYGVRTVLCQIADRLPWVRFMALAPGQMAQQLEPEAMLWVGSRGVSLKIDATSTWSSLARVARALPTFWKISGEIGEALPAGPILFHCHSIFIALVASLVRVRNPSRNVAVLFHFHSTMNRRRWWGLLSVVQRWVVGRAVDTIVAVSHAVAAYWLPIRCPVIVVHNGIDASALTITEFPYAIQPGVKNIIIAGSLSSDKGHIVAVDAMGLLGRDASKFHLWVAGGPTDHQLNPFSLTLEHRIHDLELERHVTVLGHVDHIRALLPYMWLGLQLRVSPEPCGMWILETMHAGLPLVASATGGTLELVRDQIEAIAVPANDARSVADAILLLSHNPALHASLSARSKGRASTFTVDAFIRGLLVVYEGLDGSTD